MPLFSSSLKQVQRADIYRFVVTTFLGGIYADIDTICKRPVESWGVNYDDSLILGVEAQNIQAAEGPLHEGPRKVLFAQYVFGSAAFHPAGLTLLKTNIANQEKLLNMSELNPADRLSTVLATTGRPVVGTM